MEGSWPLSAASTALLLDPRASADRVLRLTVVELALRGVWVLQPVELARRWRRPRRALLLSSGQVAAGDRVPLALLDGACGPPTGSPVRLDEALAAVVSSRPALSEECRQACLDDLVARRLVSLEPRRLRSARVRVTPTGSAWAGRARDELTRWSAEPASGAVAVLALPALVPLLDASALGLLDQALDRARRHGEVPLVEGGLHESALHHRLLDLQSDVDAAVDAGAGDASGGDGGGDGGGGGGD